MKNLSAILALVIALTACATQSPAMPSPILVSQDSQPFTPTMLPRESLATQTPEGSGGRNQGTRSQQPQNPPARQTPQAQSSPQTNRGSDASQNLSLDVAADPIDVILGRPTQRSVTASVLAYQDGEGYIEFGTQRGVHPSKTPMRQFTKSQPVEILIDSLQPDTRYYYQLFYRAGNSGGFTPVEEKSFHTQRAPSSAFTFDTQADSHLDSNSNLDVYARAVGERACR